MRRYALIIVNNEFNAPKLTQLATPGRDAKLLVEVLEDQALGDFEVTTCFNRSCAAVLEEIEGLYRRKQKDDVLLLYYAGHCIKDDFDDLFFACRNTKMHRFRSSSVSAAFIRSELEKCKAQRKVVVLDCVYCGMIEDTDTRETLGSHAGTCEAFDAEGDGRVVLTAGNTVRYAWDNDRLMGQAEASVFTQYLIEGLINGAAAREGHTEISLDDLYDYVYRQIAGAGQSRETPGKWGGRIESPIIIARTPMPESPTVGVAPSETEPPPPPPPVPVSADSSQAPVPVDEIKEIPPVPEVEVTSPIVQQLQDSLLTSSYSNSIGIEFVLVKPGQFDMGADDEDDDEKPVHHVNIDTPFYLGKCQVTQAQWEAVMGNNPSRFKGPDHPVETVSWDDVNEFIRRLSDIEGTNQYRLPMEEEWEYACCAGTTTPFSSGETITTDQANFNGNFPVGDTPKGEYRKQTSPVGSFPPNPWGLYDMHGNVWEWTENWYRSYAAGPETEDEEHVSGAPRIIRGGSWRNSARSCRSAKRFNITPVYRNPTVGFRLVRTIEE